jgi:hypothetical protein
MGSPQKSPHLVRRKARTCVQLWFRRHSTELNQWTAEVRCELQSAKDAGDSTKASSAAGRFAEKLFWEAQRDLATKVKSKELYESALRVLIPMVRMHVWRLVKKTLGTSPGVRWTACFPERMRQLVDACREQDVELFKSDIGLVIEPGQQAEIAVGGPDEGIRIRSSPTHFSEYLRNGIRVRGFKSVRDLAKQALLSPTVIYKLIKGGRVKNQTLNVLADVLEIPFEAFVDVVHRHWEAVAKVNKK